MVLSALSSTYQLYKQDTDSVAGWLASTAKTLGFTDDLDNESGPSRRLKGKARTKGKKQAAKSKQVQSSASQKYVIRTKDFVPLAEYIAGKSEPVPASFKHTIARVIAARTGFGDKLEKHGKPVTELSDAKHQYFIQVLENVRDVLMPFMPVDTGASKASTEEWLSNRFSNLAVFEPSQEFLDAPEIERPQKVQDDSATYEAEAEDSLEDAMFALAVVIDDMNRVRASISWIWANYRVGVFDLAAASIATNTAIDLVRNIMEDILPVIDKHGGLSFMLEKFFFVQCLMRNLKKHEIMAVGIQDNLNYNNTYDIGEGTYFIVFRQVESFLNVLEPGQIPLYKEGMFGYYDPASDRSHKSGQQKFEDDRALLMPFFTQLSTAVRGVQDWPVKDEFTRGMQELDKTKKVPFYMVFAAQIFLDITYELRKDIERPFSTLIDHTTIMDNDIKSHFEFHEKLKIKNWPAKNDHWLQGLQRSIQWIGKDPLRSVQRRIIQRSGFDIPDPQGHRLFRMSPVISGLFLYHFRSRYHEVSLAVADAWGSIQYCAHLYHAIRQENLLPSDRWTDMDIVTTNLGNESFYIGGEAPKTPEEYFNKFSMQMGTSLAAMTRAKGRRKNTPLESKAGPRGLKDVSPVLAMFKARYVDNSGQVDFTPDHVNQIINLSLFEEETNEDGGFVLGQIDDPKKVKERKKLQNSRKHKASTNGNMPLEQLIRPLVLALHVESLEFAFPYLHFHRWCWRVLRSVKDACDPILRQLYTSAYLENESQLPWVVGWIFMAASGLEAGISDRRPLQKAAEAMEDFFATGSSSFIAKNVLSAKFGMSLEFDVEGSSDGE
ncbi:hypothetical protein F5Y18DRAFT_397995 [Xylariaceae sp. FL1019]|nr:hypothetical protein F5Y18DRAFT_397995 [Xylariaceae sp. FL1019]